MTKILPNDSLLISLTSADMINESNFIAAFKQFDLYGEKEVTMYGFLDFYLKYFLRNRFTPWLGNSGDSIIINLDSFLKELNSSNIDQNDTLALFNGDMNAFSDFYNRLINRRTIMANNESRGEYGIALHMVLKYLEAQEMILFPDISSKKL